MLLRALLGVPLFLYLPGYIAERVWLGERVALCGIERHIGRCVASVLVTGWLGLLLAELGWFSYWLLAGLLLVGCLVGWWLLFRQRGKHPARQQFGPPLGLIAGQPATSRAGGLLGASLRALQFDHLLLGILLIFGLLVARPFEIIRGGLDAGVYANTGIAIARTGSIVQHDTIVADIGQRVAAGDGLAGNIETNILGTQNGQRYLATRIRAAGFFINSGELPEGRVVPQFFHLWPTWIAIFVAMLGPTLGLVATGAAGTLGVALLGLIGRRIGGPLVGLLAALFLALMTPQVWFSRMSTSEALAQALTLAGFWAWTHFAAANERRGRIWWGMLVGGAFGALALTRIDFFLVVGPTLALLLYVAITRRWHSGYTALALTLGGLLLHAGLHTLLIARAYLIDTGIPTLQKYALTIYAAWPLLSPELQAYTIARPRSRVGDWSRLAVELTLLTSLVVAAVGLWRWSRPLRLIERWAGRWRTWLLGMVVLGLGTLAFYAYLIRPGIISADVLLHPLRPANWLRLQGYIGAPIEVPFDLYPDKPVIAVALANMVRLGWYLSPLGVLLGVSGGLLLWCRLDRRTWLLLLIATLYAVFWIVSLQGTQEQTYIYILRRYVPVVYPAFALGMAYALAELKGRSGESASRLRSLRIGVSGLLAASLVLFFVVTGRTVYAHVEYAGALAQVESISAQLGVDDIVLVRGGGPSYTEVRDTSDLVVAPLTYVYGRNALPIKGRIPGKYPEAFADQVTRWRTEGRKVFLLLGASGGDLLFPGYTPRKVGTWTLRLSEFQQLRYQKPKLSYINEVPFTLYELLPSAGVSPHASFTYDDTYAQVTGFYRSESVEPDGLRAAWTNGAGVLRLPASLQGQTLTLEVAGGKRPAVLGAAQLCVDSAAEPGSYPEGGVAELPWRELRCLLLPEQATQVSLRLPKLQANNGLLLRLRSQPWVPADVNVPGELGSADRRALGIRFISASGAGH